MASNMDAGCCPFLSLGLDALFTMSHFSPHYPQICSVNLFTLYKELFSETFSGLLPDVNNRLQ